jgi:uncharacterized protein
MQLKLDGRFADIMELCLYNTVLTSMSSDGKKFTYVNQLASSDADPSQRQEWFTCACCPPNVLRLFGQIGGYTSTCDILAPDTACIAVHLYISSTTKFEVNGRDVQVEQQSNWPWSGEINFSVTAPSVDVMLRLRIPGWADSFEVRCHDCELVMSLTRQLDLG